MMKTEAMDKYVKSFIDRFKVANDISINNQAVKDIAYHLVNPTQLVVGVENWTGLGHISAKTNGDLTLFNYKPQAQFEGRWNPYEMVCRGLIINNKTGGVVARPFDKFFNWGEGGETDRRKSKPCFGKNGR